MSYIKRFIDSMIRSLRNTDEEKIPRWFIVGFTFVSVIITQNAMILMKIGLSSEAIMVATMSAGLLLLVAGYLLIQGRYAKIGAWMTILGITLTAVFCLIQTFR